MSHRAREKGLGLQLQETSVTLELTLSVAAVACRLRCCGKPKAWLMSLQSCEGRSGQLALTDWVHGKIVKIKWKVLPLVSNSRLIPQNGAIYLRS